MNTFRYGYTRIDTDTLGLRDRDINTFRFLDDLAFDEALDITNGRDIKTHNFVNDLSMVKGRHTFKFGGNMRFIRNDNYTLRQLVHDRQRQRLVGVGRRPALPARRPVPGAGRLQRPARGRHGGPLGATAIR